MDREQLKRIIDNPLEYDETEEDSLLSMTGQLYSAQMLPSMLVHLVYSLPFVAGAIYCGNQPNSSNA